MLGKKNFFKKEPVEIVFSFDDGKALDLKIVEYLNKHDLKGMFYIIVDKVDQPGFLKWSDIKNLEAQGHKIGSHTMTHPGDLKALHDEQLQYEIQTSKEMLETVLGHPVSSFCYPRGRCDDRVKHIVAQTGYTEARGTGTPGITMVTDPYNKPGTLHIFQRKEYGEEPVLDFCKRTLDRVKEEGGYCNIWGHAEEIDRNQLWDVLDEVLRYAKDTIRNSN